MNPIQPPSHALAAAHRTDSMETGEGVGTECSVCSNIAYLILACSQKPLYQKQATAHDLVETRLDVQKGYAWSSVQNVSCQVPLDFFSRCDLVC